MILGLNCNYKSVTIKQPGGIIYGKNSNGYVFKPDYPSFEKNGKESGFMNTLYSGPNSLDVMEQLEDGSYDFIYLAPPHFTGAQGFEYFSGDCLQEYSDYIEKIIENSFRLVKEDGVTAFLSPGREYADINYRLMMDQFFCSSRHITIEKRLNPATSNPDNNYSLYFYSKLKDFEFPGLKELRPIEEFPEHDGHDYFKKRSPYRLGSLIPNFIYEWQGIVPPPGRCWIGNRGKMDELYQKNRILIEGGKVWIKDYRSEYPTTVSSVWKSHDGTRLNSFLDSQSIDRMFSMFAGRGSKVLCPFDRDGKFSLMADARGIVWTSVFLDVGRRDNLVSDIPKGHYRLVREIPAGVGRVYKKDIVTSVSDLSELKDRVKQLTEDVQKIQLSIGMDDNSEISVDAVIEKIHQQVSEVLSAFSIEGCLPEAERWLSPYWNRLEPESRHFIPTGLLLYNQFGGEPGMDMAPIMIEYCKSLEKELFKKMFFGYIKDLIARGVRIGEEFPEAFQRRNTSVFAEFLENCTNAKKEHPEEWKFEMGKMAFVLQAALVRDPRENIIKDFRNYLDRIFDRRFFRERFMDQLSIVTRLRNSCAHPSIVDSDAVEEGKEIIRNKLLAILKYYLEG